jgi:glycosyltransferase involved in cell wall biosynthesis
MKILQVNSFYPLWSTGKITHDLHTMLQKEQHQSIVCYGRGPNIEEDGIYQICTERLSRLNRAWIRISGIMYGGHYLSTTKLIQIIKKEKPDIVHLQCINSSFVNIYRLITYLKNHQIKTILTLHAEFMYTANCGYAFDCNKWKTGCGHCPRLKQETRSLLFDATAYSWWRMKRAFNGFKENLVIASVSPWLMQRAKLSPILADKKHVVVMNGLDTEVFHHYSINHLRAELGIRNDEKVIFHATPNFTDNPKHIKGGRFVIELAKRMPHIRFVVAGPIYGEPPRVPSNVLLLGSVTDPNRLAMLYSMADMTLLTSKKETFSMVCAETLSCGTPVVGFQAGAPEQISLSEYSCFVEYGNVDLLSIESSKMISQAFDHSEIAKKAKEKYSKEVMAQGYINLYKSLLNQ